MRIKRTKVYQYDELSDKAKEKARLNPEHNVIVDPSRNQ